MARPRKVHFLPGIVAPQARVPQPDVVGELTEALALAKRGEIQGLALAYVDSQRAVVTTWASGQGGSNLMAAAVAKLFHRVLSAACD